jgi:hypothetical protein
MCSTPTTDANYSILQTRRTSATGTATRSLTPPPTHAPKPLTTAHTCTSSRAPAAILTRGCPSAPGPPQASCPHRPRVQSRPGEHPACSRPFGRAPAPQHTFRCLRRREQRGTLQYRRQRAALRCPRRCNLAAADDVPAAPRGAAAVGEGSPNLDALGAYRLAHAFICGAPFAAAASIRALGPSTTVAPAPPFTPTSQSGVSSRLL